MMLHRTSEIDVRWTLQRGHFGESRSRLQARRTVREHRCSPSACGRGARPDAGGSMLPDRPGVRLLAAVLVMLLALNVTVALGFAPPGYSQLTGAVGSVLGDAVGATLVAMTFAVGSHLWGRLRRGRGEWTVSFQDRNARQLTGERRHSSRE